MGESSRRGISLSSGVTEPAPQPKASIVVMTLVKPRRSLIEIDGAFIVHQSNADFMTELPSALESRDVAGYFAIQSTRDGGWSQR